MNPTSANTSFLNKPRSSYDRVTNKDGASCTLFEGRYWMKVPHRLI